MSDICSKDGCQLTAKHDDKCALHCNKSDYHNDRRSGVLQDFYDQLAEYILIKGFPFTEEPLDETDKNLRIELNGGGIEWPQDRLEALVARKALYIKQIKGEEDNSISEVLKRMTVTFTNIIFPERDSQDHFDFFNLFKKLKGIHFQLSSIKFSRFNLKNVKVYFDECRFTNEWSINKYSLIDHVGSKTVFEHCTFDKVVCPSPAENSTDELSIDHYLFRNCHFKTKLRINRGEYHKSIFNNSIEFRQSSINLHIEKCKLIGRFELNNADIKLLTIKNMEFKEKFELKENTIEKCVIINVNFKKLFDAYKTKFLHFKISRSIFDDFTGFEKCEFGLIGTENNQPTEFEYVTFLDFTNFRKAIFLNGLDFEHTNIKEPLNFLNAEIAPKNTNRETFRIIKHSFEKIGNQIEANKYFAYEMQAHSKILEKSGWSSERIIFSLNKTISNFGASYKKPFFLMLVTALLYFLLTLGYEHNCLYEIYPPANVEINMIFSHLNNFAKGIPPYGRFLKEGMEFVTLLFHIIFLTFTWHFIIAVKRHTKR